VQDISDSEDLDDTVLASRAGAASRVRCTRRWLVAGMSIAGLCMATLLSVGLLMRGHSETAATRWGVSEAEVPSGDALFGKPGQQCGGQGFQGNTCCQAGCACIYKDQSYSECQPPLGLTNCNTEAAKLQLEVSNQNLARVKDNVAATAKMGAIFQATALNSHDGFMKAEKARKDAWEYGLAKRVVWQANKDKKVAAQLAVDQAQKKVNSLVGTNTTLVAELTALQKASFDNGLTPPKCSQLYESCKPSQGCCSGCICLAKAAAAGAFQCLAPGQEQECNVATAQAKVQVKVAEVQAIGNRLLSAQTEAQEATVAAQQATAASASAFKEAAAAGALREDAVEAAARAQMDSEIEERQANKARDLAKKAYEAEEIEQAVAAAWEKATAGNAC